MLTFLDQATAKALKQENSEGLIVLEMIPPGLGYGPSILVPVVEGVTFDGKKAKVVLDTGMVTVISLSSAAAKRVGLTLPPEKSAAGNDIGSLHLALTN